MKECIILNMSATKNLSHKAKTKNLGHEENNIFNNSMS